ncbi:hypothetical protein LAZ67_11001045 [Cordylochernes scorpioides]|uniref:Uncharacterized protein n=1 Tax=Cordylochernes scorpioides TaxID=51811 RepID=A0ABY6L335_9ARAC|nr:hypothetical protein LAZ67_11001045 [Cordylochernes scorpioides]
MHRSPFNITLAREVQPIKKCPKSPFNIPLIHDDKHSPLHFKRLQFPIQVSLAISIKKAQGQSLKIAGIDLEQPCFSHRQLYVDCSRVGSGRNIYVLAPENKTSNFVYSSVLS